MRIALERREALQPRLDVPEVDLPPKEADLVVERRLTDVDVPGLESPITAVAPPAPPLLQRVLELERGLLSHTRTVALRVCSRAASAGARRGQDEVQDIEQRVAVVDRPVGLVEEPVTVQQVAQLRAGEAMGAPSEGEYCRPDST